jgi:hypothetical protein
MYINLKGGPCGTHLFLFCDWWSKGVLILGSAQCSKNIGDGPINMTLSKTKKKKKKKKSVNTPMN